MNLDHHSSHFPSSGQATYGFPSLESILARLGVAGSDVLMWVLMVIMIMLLLLTAGCSGETNLVTESVAPPKTTTAQKSVPRTNSVATDTTLVRQSPAAPATDVDEMTATPERVCKHFMERLQQGDRIGAENLLTRAALSTTTRANLRLEPVGSPAAKYKIMPARYATTQHRLAQVDCRIVDTIDGQPSETGITWLARRQSSGWRISGIMVDFESGQGRDLLSFESVDDVATIKMLASGEAIEESDASRQANAVDGETTLQ